MAIDTIEALESAVQAAEDRLRRGDMAGAFSAYRAILLGRLTRQATAGPALISADLVVIERVAELATLFGHTDIADDLLSKTAALNAQARNRSGEDYATLKRVNLALVRGRLRRAHELLDSLRPSIGDLSGISFSPGGLNQWEAGRSWPNTTPADRAVLFSQLYFSMGWLLAANGRYQSAVAAFERGLTHTGKDAPDLARQMDIRLRLALAGALLERGELDAAGRRLAEAEPELDATQRPGLAVRWREISGKLALLRGDFGRALAMFGQVIAICRERDFHQAALAATLNLAHVSIALNQTAKASELLLALQRQASALGDRAAEMRAGFLLQLTQARARSLAEDVPIAPSVFEIWSATEATTPRDGGPAELPLETRQADSYLTFFEDRMLAIQWQIGNRDLPAAIRLFDQARQVFGACDSALIQVRLKVIAGMLAYYQDEPELASQLLETARTTLRDMALAHELWQAQRVLGWCWARLGRPALEQRALAEDTDALLAATTGSLDGAEQTIFLLNKWTTDEEFIVMHINELVRRKAILLGGSRLLRPWRRLALMRRLGALIEHIDRYKGQQAQHAIHGAEPRPAGRPRWLWRLLTHPRDRATVSFLVLPDRVLVTRMTWISLDFSVSSTTRIQIRDNVRRWHELVGRVQRHWRGQNMPAEPGRSPADPQHLSEKSVDSGSHAAGRPAAWLPESKKMPVEIVSQRGVFVLDDNDEPVTQPAKLMEEGAQIADQLAASLMLKDLLDGLPQRIRALTIVPEDSLHGFPFAALMHGGQYLAQRYALSVAFESNPARPNAAPHPDAALVVGVSRGAEQFGPLPGALAELELIATWLGRQNIAVHRLVNDTASKAAVLARLPQSALLHIACHGTFQHNRPDSSGLVLIPTPGRAEVLSLRELSALDLTKVQHATLSSCWSADHFILPGRWVIGLPETLWRAGAQSVLGCLWEVNDRVAVAFMARFYAYLDHLPRDEALRRTQLDCLHSALPGCDGVDTSHPMLWAGFHLYGATTRIKL